MAEAAGISSGATRRFLTFRVDGQLYALPAEAVSEVIRVPPLARVPHAPRGLLGLGNLRGSVLPFASARALLQREGAEAGDCRAVVLDGAAPAALAVDRVEGLVSVGPEALEARQAELAAGPGERVSGAFQAGADQDVAKILDLDGLLQGAFTPSVRARRAASSARLADDGAGPAQEHVQRLVSFEVAGQEFALPLEAVREIINPPASVSLVPRTEAVLLGLAPYRDTLLPLLSLRGLLGFPPAAAQDGREKVVVAAVGGVLVGLVADRMRAIVPAEPSLVEAAPAMLAARAGGESRIAAIYRGDGGRRLISILAPEQLFREDVMQRLGDRTGAAWQDQAGAETGARLMQILVFRLGEDEFGLPIEAVDEVAQAPDQVTRVPKTPKFLEGVMNLRGAVLPIIDQRRRFDMPPLASRDGRRLVVVRTARHRAGLIVDSVSEVLRVSEEAVEPAPDLTGESHRLVHGVVNLERHDRIILLLDPAELLTRAESAVLDAFAPEGQADR